MFLYKYYSHIVFQNVFYFVQVICVLLIIIKNDLIVKIRDLPRLVYTSKNVILNVLKSS